MRAWLNTARMCLPGLLAALLVGCASSSRIAGTHPESSGSKPKTTESALVLPPPTIGNSSIDTHTFLTHMMPYMGIRYVYDGSDSAGFDCSGFTSRMFAEVLGKTIPHSTADQYTLGTAVDKDALRFGDLVFFAIDTDSPSHVGIYVGDGLFAHASVSLGVTISLLDSNYYKKRFYGARRIVP